MPDRATLTCALLKRLKDKYGDLNTAHVATCLKAGQGGGTIAGIARVTGLSRDAVRRCLANLSESDRAG